MDLTTPRRGAAAVGAWVQVGRSVSGGQTRRPDACGAAEDRRKTRLVRQDGRRLGMARRAAHSHIRRGRSCGQLINRRYREGGTRTSSTKPSPSDWGTGMKNAPRNRGAPSLETSSWGTGWLLVSVILWRVSSARSIVAVLRPGAARQALGQRLTIWWGANLPRTTQKLDRCRDAVRRCAGAKPSICLWKPTHHGTHFHHPLGWPAGTL